MPFKLNISYKGKTYKLESESQEFSGKKIGNTILGKDIDSKLEGYEFKITGASDKEGFPAISDVEGIGRRRILMTRSKGMQIKKPKGLRVRKTIHANTIDEDISQINLTVSKLGAKPLDEVFGAKEQKENLEENKMEEKQKQEEKKEETEQEEKAEEQPAEKEEKTAEEKTEEAPSEEKKEKEETEEKEEIKEEKPAEEKPAE